MRRPLAIFCLLLIILLASSARFSSNYESEYGHLKDQKISVTGTVEDISYKKKESFLQPVITLKEGAICYMAALEGLPEIGSSVTISGKVFIFENATNEGQFDMRNYYEIMGIHYGLSNAVIVNQDDSKYSYLKNALFLMRRSFSEKLDEFLPENEAGVMKTMLLGEKSELDTSIKELYQRNGIAHVLAISGLHISLIGILLYRLLLKAGLGINKSSIIALSIVFLYGAMTGFSVSAIRAVFMFVLSMLANLFGRSYDFMTAVSLSALSILLSNPLFIYHSGFIFSYGCILGIGLLVPTLTSDKVSENTPEWVKKLLSTLTILVSGIPVYYWYYYQIPVYSYFLNFLVIPIMSILVSAGILLIGMGYFIPQASVIIKYLIVGILRLFEQSAQLSDKLPFHYYTPGKPHIIQIVIYVGILIMLVLFKKKLSLKHKWLIVGVAILLLTVRYRMHFEIDFLDVGQGDGIYIHCTKSSIVMPGISKEFTMLVDGGSTDVKEVGKYRIIPFLKYKGISYVDVMVFTHPDKDHMNGLIELLESGATEGIRVGKIIIADIDGVEENEEFGEILKYGVNKEAKEVKEGFWGEVSKIFEKDNKVDITKMSCGDEIKFGELNCLCLSPNKGERYSDLNETSVALYVNYKDFSALLTGDIEGNAERALITKLIDNDIGNIDVLKVAHHGSKNSTPKNLLEILQPDISVISVGKDNRYGHPHEEMLERLSLYTPNSRVFRTDECGEIRIYLDKKTIKLKFMVKNSHYEL